MVLLLLVPPLCGVFWMLWVAYPPCAPQPAVGRKLRGRRTARLARTFCAMAAAHTEGLPNTVFTCRAAARAAVCRVIGCPAAACRFNVFTVRRTIVGTARTAG